MLTKIKFAPGIDKQDTAVGAEGRWVDSDNVRFRYGLPEKVGGWQSLLTDSIVGVARKQHAFVDTAGNRYIAIGTDKFLLVYFEGQLFDITPFVDNNAGVLTKSCPSKYISKNLSVPIATYLFPSLSTKECCALATPCIVSVSKEDQPPIFSGSPYLNLTRSESTQRPAAPTLVSCLSIPGANFISVSIYLLL
jgi:hypothetical protein